MNDVNYRINYRSHPQDDGTTVINIVRLKPYIVDRSGELEHDVGHFRRLLLASEVAQEQDAAYKQALQLHVASLEDELRQLAALAASVPAIAPVDAVIPAPAPDVASSSSSSSSSVPSTTLRQRKNARNSRKPKPLVQPTFGTDRLRAARWHISYSDSNAPRLHAFVVTVPSQ
jgi:hypothetical protein